MLGAAICCVLFRVNLPLALLSTLYTNPFTIVPLYLAAFGVGEWLIGSGSVFTLPPELGALPMSSWAGVLIDWMAGLGKPLALGLVAMAAALASTGYLVVRGLYRWHLIRAWRRRAIRRSRHETLAHAADSGDRCTRHPTQLRRILTRIYVALGVLVLLLITGTCGFLVVGKGEADLSDAFYMTLITITTVGYAEVVPIVGFPARLFTGAISLAGFGAVTFLFSSLAVFSSSGTSTTPCGDDAWKKQIGKLRQHYIICGFGRVGRNVAHELRLRIGSSWRSTSTRASSKTSAKPSRICSSCKETAATTICWSQPTLRTPRACSQSPATTAAIS